MNLNTNQKLLREYLLGKLPEEKTIQLEERYFTDQEFLCELRDVERDLIDSYVRDEISSPDREKFETHFLASPSRRRKVKFAQAFLEFDSRPTLTGNPALSRSDLTPVSWWQNLLSLVGGTATPVWVAAILIATLGASILLFKLLVHDREDRARQVAQQQAIETQPPSEVSNPSRPMQKPSPAPSVAETAVHARLVTNNRSRIATFVLSPSLVRGGEEPNPLIMPASAKTALLRLILDDDEYKTYQVALQTTEGAVVWTREELKPTLPAAGKPKQIQVSIPAGLLTNRDYVMRLSGGTSAGEVDNVANYFFKVVKE